MLESSSIANGLVSEVTLDALWGLRELAEVTDGDLLQLSFGPSWRRLEIAEAREV
jgi:hypothetical protein